MKKINEKKIMKKINEKINDIIVFSLIFTGDLIKAH